MAVRQVHRAPEGPLPRRHRGHGLLHRRHRSPLARPADAPIQPITGGSQLVIDTTQAALERLLLKEEIEQFLYLEADLLDTRQFEQWIELVAEDIHYHMPIRRNVKFGEQSRENTDSRSEISWFDE